MSKPKYQSRQRFPRPSFDQVHADAIDADVLLQDPTISNWDRREGRPWVKEFDAKYRAAATAPKSPPIPAPRDTRPVETYQVRKSRHVAAWVTGFLFFVVCVLLIVAVAVS